MDCGEAGENRTVCILDHPSTELEHHQSYILIVSGICHPNVAAYGIVPLAGVLRADRH